MTIFTKGPTIQSGFIAENLPTPWTTYLSATAEDVLERSPVRSLNYLMEEQRLDESTPWLTQEQANEKTQDLPYKLDIPDDGISEGRLGLLKDTKHKEMVRNNLIENAPDGFLMGGLGFGTALLTSFADPLNIAMGFIPVVGAARYSSMLAKAGVSTVSRAGVRMRVGAIEGAAGAAIAEPLIAYSAHKQQAEYGALDSVMAIGFGSVFGGGLHMGSGMVVDKVLGSARIQAGIDAKELLRQINADNMVFGKADLQNSISAAIRTSDPGNVTYSSTIARIDQLSPEDREQLGRSAIAQLLDDTPVDVDPLLKVQELAASNRKLLAGRTVDDEPAIRDEVTREVIMAEQVRKSGQRVSAEDKKKFGDSANTLRTQIATLESQLKELSGRPMSVKKRGLVDEIKQKKEALDTLRTEHKAGVRDDKALAKKLKQAKEGKLPDDMQRKVDEEVINRMETIKQQDAISRESAGKIMSESLDKMKAQQVTAGQRLYMPDAREIHEATVSRLKEDSGEQIEAQIAEMADDIPYLEERYGVTREQIEGNMGEAIKQLDNTVDNFESVAMCLAKEAA